MPMEFRDDFADYNDDDDDDDNVNDDDDDNVNDDDDDDPTQLHLVLFLFVNADFYFELWRPVYFLFSQLADVVWGRFNTPPPDVPQCGLQNEFCPSHLKGWNA